jgi:hypothetical protein
MGCLCGDPGRVYDFSTMPGIRKVQFGVTKKTNAGGSP